MPFDQRPSRPNKIAVVGSGISGMSAAYLLSRDHDVTLFESEGRLGGHARTVLAGKNGDQPVDTGFIVFNYANYPHLTKLFDELDVPVEKSQMSFGVSVNDGGFEYALTSFNALFAQKRNFVNPAFYRMVRDIFRFNSSAVAALDGTSMSLGDLLQSLKLGHYFRNYYILPFSGAIWSMPPEEMLKFPAEALIRFFQNHNLMTFDGQHQWYTVTGGSVSYVTRLSAAMEKQGVNLHLNTPVYSVRRDAHGVLVRSKGSQWERFDQVVFACHSDDALRMLANPSKDEQRLLGSIGYQTNNAILHRDPSVMPKRKSCWSSWVYTSKKKIGNAPIGVTYWMNALQNIPENDLLLGTLNPTHEIREDLIYEQTTFRHPVFNAAALAAQPQFDDIQGQNSTWYCGAYLKNGFHEDGMSSGVDVARRLSGVSVWS